MNRKKKIEELKRKMWDNHIKDYDGIQEQIRKELNLSSEELKLLQKESMEPQCDYDESDF